MKAIILAAGEGTRMRPLTLKTPKPLLPINGLPILGYVFEALPNEVTEVIVVVKYLGEQIREFLGGEYGGRKVCYAEGSDRGTAYSFLAAKEYFEKDERFLFLNGDELPFKENIDACMEHSLSALVFEAENPHAVGIAEVDDEHFIIEVEEKPENPKSNFGVDGIMVLDSSIFSYKPRANDKGEYYFTSLVSQFVKNKKVKAVLADKFVGDITTPEDILRVEKILQNMPNV
jgi:UDP-N-acetylglucosamine diphosphorylase / glucose-1-phosphate thymidylyltransferase / UDP-N-acetylgalactosamine diphosphorylase / glucosamine-1-phosphate N-acetyltransferase / galactosamine-1-phosphate N-acetyltransferase